MDQVWLCFQVATFIPREKEGKKKRGNRSFRTEWHLVWSTYISDEKPVNHMCIIEYIWYICIFVYVFVLHYVCIFFIYIILAYPSAWLQKHPKWATSSSGFFSAEKVGVFVGKAICLSKSCSHLHLEPSIHLQLTSSNKNGTQGSVWCSCGKLVDMKWGMVCIDMRHLSASFPRSDLEEVMSHIYPRKEDVMPGYSDCEC